MATIPCSPIPCARVSRARLSSVAGARLSGVPVGVAPRASRASTLVVRAGGFGDSGKKLKQKAAANNPEPKNSMAKPTKVPPPQTDLKGWTKAELKEAPTEGEIKAAIVNGKGYAFVMCDENMYAIDVNCPSCKFPMMNGEVTGSKETGQPSGAVTCPLCKSEFWLETGGVKEWCPKDAKKNLFGGVMANLKKADVPVGTNVYMARAENGSGFIKF